MELSVPNQSYLSFCIRHEMVTSPEEEAEIIERLLVEQRRETLIEFLQEEYVYCEEQGENFFDRLDKLLNGEKD